MSVLPNAEPALPLNPDRFTRLSTEKLLGLAQEWLPMEAAFGSCLNIGLMRGEAEFAARCAAKIQTAPLLQCFYLYRSGQLWAPLKELITGHIYPQVQHGGKLSSLALDAAVAAKSFDADLHRDLIIRLIESKPDLQVSPTIDAFFSREAAALGLEQENFDSRSHAHLNIIGMTKVRNEGELVSRCVGNLLTFCDFVLIFDDKSSDGAPEQTVARFGADRVAIVRRTDGGVFNEQITYDMLFAAARARQATHMVLLDADEIASPRLADAKSLREKARRMIPGEALTVQFRQISGRGFIDFNRFSALNEQKYFLPLYKDFLYCDDGQALHRGGTLHNPWLPKEYPKKRQFAHEDDICILHYEKANPFKLLMKNDWYILKELFVYNKTKERVLAEYLPMQIVSNHTFDNPPEKDALAAIPCDAYLQMPMWRLPEIKALLPKLPPDLQFLMNGDYSDL